MPAIYAQIRKAIRQSEKTRYRLWKETGITQAQLSAFMAEKKGLSVEALETLAAHLGLRVMAMPARRPRSRTKIRK